MVAYQFDLFADAVSSSDDPSRQVVIITFHDGSEWMFTEVSGYNLDQRPDRITITGRYQMRYGNWVVPLASVKMASVLQGLTGPSRQIQMPLKTIHPKDEDKGE